MPGVATGVVKFEGSSEVNMVAVDGESVYRADSSAVSAGVNPVKVSISLADRSRSTYLATLSRCRV